jgi:hypothetical protein
VPYFQVFYHKKQENRAPSLERNKEVSMQTAENVIHSIYLLPEEEKGKLAVHMLKYGIMGPYHNSPEVLDLKQWQADIAMKPFNLKEASENLGISEVTLRRWAKKGRLTAQHLTSALRPSPSDL